ncbi:MAG: hypothetical protein RIS70_722 [Planctomycetota bacterium]|jgi:segregation and condensation protein B
MRVPPVHPAQALKSISRRYCLPNVFQLNCRSTFCGNLAARTRRGGGGSSEPVEPDRSSDPTDEEPVALRLQRLEAILFLAREPLSARRLSQYANLADGTEARTLIRRLNQRFDNEGRAFRVEEIAGGFQLLTRSGFASWLRRLGHVPAEIRLSAPALETLAVIAYRQPVLRADIEAIRGVNCGEMLRQLMERDLVRICGRGDELGRPYQYGTTKRFLQTFGLVDLDQLPRADQLKNSGRKAGTESRAGADSELDGTINANKAPATTIDPLACNPLARDLSDIEPEGVETEHPTSDAE